MPFSLTPVAKTSAGSTNGGVSVTTSAIDTTGANLIVLVVADYTLGSTPTDSKGNTYTPRTGRTTPNTNGSVRIWDCLNPIVGTGHTFTVSGGTQYPSVNVLAFSGAHATAAFDHENGAAGAALTSLGSGSITPSGPAALVIFGYGGGSSSNPSVPGYTDAGLFVPIVGAQHYGSASFYTIQNVAVATSPTAFFGFNDPSVVIASYLPASAAGGPGRVTQSVLELVTLPSAPARVTQVAMEVVTLPASPSRVTQFVTETITLPPSPGRVSQMVVETITRPAGGEKTQLWID